jgi:hypothetical protein
VELHPPHTHSSHSFKKVGHESSSHCKAGIPDLIDGLPFFVSRSMVLWLMISIDILLTGFQETTAYVINDAGAKACLEVTPGAVHL